MLFASHVARDPPPEYPTTTTLVFLLGKAQMLFAALTQSAQM
jgi:hypothetical protein